MSTDKTFNFNDKCYFVELEVNGNSWSEFHTVEKLLQRENIDIKIIK